MSKDCGRSVLDRIKRRKNRVRLKLKKSSTMRLSVFKSNRHFYAQLIDDSVGHTIASASTLEPQLRDVANRRVNVDSVKAVAGVLYDRLQKINLNKSFVFDRGPYRYTGVISEFADSLRNLGLKF